MVGILLYWAILLLWVAVVTYFLVFDVLPMMPGKSHGKKDAHHGKHAHPAPEAKPGYSVYDGFKSFADKDGTLTPEAIVKGLSRHDNDL